MFRYLVMFPAAVDPFIVDDLVARAASRLRVLPGYQSMTTSVEALMGPSAKAGGVSRIMETDFATLDDALAALHDPGFQEVRSTIEALEPTILLYELSKL
jgi:hypothetical protein